MANEQTGVMTFQTCDVKIEQNSRGYNVSVHVYEFANKEKIDATIANAIYAMFRTQREIAKQLLEVEFETDLKKTIEESAKTK